MDTLPDEILETALGTAWLTPVEIGVLVYTSRRFRRLFSATMSKLNLKRETHIDQFGIVAVTLGYLNILQWAFARGLYKMNPIHSGQFGIVAVDLGHLDILQWAHAHGLFKIDPKSLLLLPLSSPNYQKIRDWLVSLLPSWSLSDTIGKETLVVNAPLEIMVSLFKDMILEKFPSHRHMYCSNPYELSSRKLTRPFTHVESLQGGPDEHYDAIQAITSAKNFKMALVPKFMLLHKLDKKVYKDAPVRQLVYCSRHYGVTLVINADHVHSIDPQTREQSRFVCVFPHQSALHVDVIYRTFFQDMTSNVVFREIILACQRQNALLVLDKRYDTQTPLRIYHLPKQR